MNLDWGIVWDSRHALLEGAGMTVLLTVATMALAVPGGIVLALMRLSSNRPPARPPPSSWSFSATCR